MTSEFSVSAMMKVSCTCARAAPRGKATALSSSARTWVTALGVEHGRKRRLGAVGEAEGLTVGHGSARRPRHAGQRLLGQARRGAVLRAAKRLVQGGDDQGAHRLRIAESELGLGRMHVHVDLIGWQREEERKHGMPPVGHEVAVTAAHGAGEQLVAHRPAIDHEMLPEAVGAM